MIRKIVLAFTLFISANFALASTTPDVIPPHPTKAIQTYINQLVKKYNFNKTKLTRIMDQAQYNPKVIHWITHPFEKKPWDYYRHFFLRQDRIDNGVVYWNTHRKILSDVQKRYGVDPSVIIAIIGIESFYGKRTGTYNILNALTTLSFYYPKRQKFFKSELTQFLLLTRHEKLNPLNLKGSYAGALGIPQFMPSSYRHYGVDYSNNQSIDLFTNHFDAIASIGNYIDKAGWQPGRPVAVPAIVKKNIPKKLISKSGYPRYTIRQLRRYGIRPETKVPGKTKAALIVMHNTDSDEYWLVFRNFRAIMRYNPRTTYALAVYELSSVIKEDYEQQAKQTSTSTPTSSAG